MLPLEEETAASRIYHESAISPRRWVYLRLRDQNRDRSKQSRRNRRNVQKTPRKLSAERHTHPSPSQLIVTSARRSTGVTVQPTIPPAASEHRQMKVAFTPWCCTPPTGRTRGLTTEGFQFLTAPAVHARHIHTSPHPYSHLIPAPPHSHSGHSVLYHICVV